MGCSLSLGLGMVYHFYGTYQMELVAGPIAQRASSFDVYDWFLVHCDFMLLWLWFWLELWKATNRIEPLVKRIN